MWDANVLEVPHACDGSRRSSGTGQVWTGREPLTEAERCFLSLKPKRLFQVFFNPWIMEKARDPDD